ncbi:MAG: PilW family protein [Candidatus Muiribacteriota bacterium]
MLTYNSKKGFTLVELMIVVAIFGLVGIIILNIFQRTQRTFYQGQLKNIVESEAQLLIENLKRDLAMSCRLEADGNKLVDSILDIQDTSDGKTVSFSRFIKYESGVPVSKKVSYIYNSDNNTVTRHFEGESSRTWEGVESFTLHYYGLLPHQRYFYNIQALFRVGHDTGKLRSEKMMIATSVESRYENNLVNFPGWIRNPNSYISE